ncbi:MAG: sigma-54-dependent Fis family transcriptional regulator [Acidobacteria bacterium]|nr:sigma-54-dependent Fis family transcriptional regulator [Acidobacteriota bacterium]
MAVKEKILVVDDEPSIRKYLQTLLEVDGFEVETVGSGKEALAKISDGDRPDFIIIDVLMPEMNGLDTLRELLHLDRSLNIIMLSCSNEVGTVVEAIRIGAHDYLTKPFEKSDLDAAMLKSRQKKHLAQENQALRDYCDQVTEDLSFLAASPQMVRIRQQILQIAPVDVPVFICGESGVGKEVVARMIHLRSKRRNQAFIKVNCAALPGELLESELFGFEQGAFTGAHRAKPGKFELANKGTIFLDEIAEMSTHLQAKLLHVLQDHQYSRLGGRHMVDTDVRVLAATNVDVQEAMKSGRFREDLYYRLNVLSILVPPLRERATEIPLLFRHFLDKYSEKFGKGPMTPSKHLLDAAANYPWPGNLRELENFVKRYVILEDDEGSLRELVEMSSARQRTSPRQEVSVPREQGLKALVRGLKDEAEMEAIADALEKTRWCRKDAAKMLGISYKALLYKMRQFNLDTPRTRRSSAQAAAEEPAPVGAVRGE